MSTDPTNGVANERPKLDLALREELLADNEVNLTLLRVADNTMARLPQSDEVEIIRKLMKLEEKRLNRARDALEKA